MDVNWGMKTIQIQYKDNPPVVFPWLDATWEDGRFVSFHNLGRADADTRDMTCRLAGMGDFVSMSRVNKTSVFLDRGLWSVTIMLNADFKVELYEK